jgi:hypothetical protein
MKNDKYINEVHVALVKLQVAQDTEVSDAPEDHVAMMHPAVVEAHKHLKKACWMYRRRQVVSLLVRWGEWQAVSMGYLRYDVKSDDFKPMDF